MRRRGAAHRRRAGRRALAAAGRGGERRGAPKGAGSTRRTYGERGVGWRRRGEHLHVWAAQDPSSAYLMSEAIRRHPIDEGDHQMPSSAQDPL